MVSILRKAGFFIAFILPMLLVAGFYLGGYWNYITLIFAFVILPALDQAIGTDKTNVPEDKINAVGEAFYYRMVTYLWTYFQFALVVWAAFAVSGGRLTNFREWVGFVLSFSIVSGGIGITVAHELGHKKTGIERLYSKLLLMTVGYMHFYIEHNRGHHVAVATPEDPATARKNENFFAFWLRSVFIGYGHAWTLEKERLAKRGLPVLSIRNEMIWFAVLPVLFCTVLTFVVSYGHGAVQWHVPLFFAAQSFFAFSLLELVNYVEHYGIMRKEIAPGRYERVNPVHSWNSSHLMSNFFLFQLQRHSDHHAYAHKRYQLLNHYDISPQLPCGYSTMILLALLPPVWFNVMNRRLEAWSTANA